MNAALAMIEAAAPKDEIEGALVVQMAATHAAVMAVLARLDAALAPERHVNLRSRATFPRVAGEQRPCRDAGVGAIALALRCSREQNALHTLIRQRRLTPSCGGRVPTAERTLDPARMFMESLTTGPELENSLGRSEHDPMHQNRWIGRK